MELAELNASDQAVLVGLVRHLVLADGGISDAELYELIRIGVAIGKPEFKAALEATEALHTDREAILTFAERTTEERPQSTILGELDRIAHSDGLHAHETEFMDLVKARWA